jgi:hypothetical protein
MDDMPDTQTELLKPSSGYFISVSVDIASNASTGKTVKQGQDANTSVAVVSHDKPIALLCSCRVKSQEEELATNYS